MKGVSGWKRIWLQALEAIYIWRRDGEPARKNSSQVICSISLSADLKREAESIDDAPASAGPWHVLYHISKGLMSHVIDRSYDSQAVTER